MWRLPNTADMRWQFIVLVGLNVLFCPGWAAEPIADSDLRTKPELLRGYSDAELKAARLAVPKREEPATPDSLEAAAEQFLATATSTGARTSIAAVEGRASLTQGA